MAPASTISSVVVSVRCEGESASSISAIDCSLKKSKKLLATSTIASSTTPSATSPKHGTDKATI